MNALTIGVNFITGRCVAADVAQRESAEWPPHPGRVFMALAAACFETGEVEAEVAALEWLESLAPPRIYASDEARRSAVKYYVPVNDKITASKSLLQSAPGMSRSKQERTYPTVVPADPVVLLVWERAEDVEKHIDALSSVCANVIRVGHSSSLVQCWAEAELPNSNGTYWAPTDADSQLRARVAGVGEFRRLRAACKADTIERFADLKEQIEQSKGKERREAKKLFQSVFGTAYKASLRPPEPTPAVLGLWQGYRRVASGVADQEPGEIVAGQHFDSELLILTKQDGRNLDLTETLVLTRMLRNAAMDRCPVDPTPAWLGGHEEDQQPTQEPHTAFIPLPFAGYDYADGHLLGLALALPKRIPPEHRGPILGRLLVDENGAVRDITLDFKRLGPWILRLEDRPDPPRSLRNSTWVGPSECWASVTPVVLDRFPKSSRADERPAWEDEVRAIIAQSCVRAGLPDPIEVDIDTTAWHRGVPRAFRKVRPLRDRRSKQREDVAPLGEGFPHLPSRPGKPTRPQIHVFVRFAQRVLGPVLLGAGRFQGYGMCKPIRMARKPK